MDIILNCNINKYIESNKNSIILFVIKITKKFYIYLLRYSI